MPRRVGLLILNLRSSQSTTHEEKPPQPPTLEDTIRQLFSHIKHPDFASSFTDPTGAVYTHNNSIWTEPLGKDLLIVDVDTRYPDQMFDPKEKVDWEHLDTNNLVTEAVFNHYLYGTLTPQYPHPLHRNPRHIPQCATSLVSDITYAVLGFAN